MLEELVCQTQAAFLYGVCILTVIQVSAFKRDLQSMIRAEESKGEVTESGVTGTNKNKHLVIHFARVCLSNAPCAQRQRTPPNSRRNSLAIKVQTKAPKPINLFVFTGM
jgi:hypothetical protein